MKTRISLTAIILSLSLPVPAFAAGALEFNVQVHQLTNGMKMLLLEDHAVPNVATHLFYRVGARNERPRITGLSHFFEHMMFNGANKFGPGMFDRVMEDNGGANNAFTSEDITGYQNWHPTAAMPLIFELEADRITSLSFDPKMVEAERGVVANERRLSVDNNNESLLHEQLVAAAFTAHPYGWPVIGWASDIEAWKREDLIQYFKTYYAPNNCSAKEPKPALPNRSQRSWILLVHRLVPAFPAITPRARRSFSARMLIWPCHGSPIS